MREDIAKPTIRGGLERGVKGTIRIATHPKGKKLLLTIVGSMLWIFILMPASCMKLNEAFPKTGTGFFVGFVMYVAWITFLVITRKKRGF